MSANSANILAGIGSTTSIGSVAYFAAADTAGPAAVAYTAEVQTVNIGGVPTGGTFALTWQGLTSTAQAFNVPTATLATSLNTAWASLLHGGLIAVAGTAGTTYTITFPAALGNVPPITGDKTLLTGGVPTIGVVETTPGAGATIATAPIPVSFLDIGWCATSGLVANVAETINKIKGFGSTQILRTIVQDSERTFDLEPMETNAVSTAIYNRLAVGSVVADTNGAFQWTIGAPNIQTYAGIFDLADGSNHLRAYCPRVQVSGIKSNSWAPGKEITYPLSLTALPDATGNSIYWSAVVNALHA
jgi:hypothetical protein